jgi:hypothetical protein
MPTILILKAIVLVYLLGFLTGLLAEKRKTETKTTKDEMFTIL